MRIFPTFISEFVAKFWLIPLVNDCQCGYITKSLLPNITIIQLYRKKSVLFKLHNCLNSSPFIHEWNICFVFAITREFSLQLLVFFANTCMDLSEIWWQTINKGCVTLVALPFTLQKHLKRQKKKKNYGNSNISPCKSIIFKKSSEKKPKSFKILL